MGSNVLRITHFKPRLRDTIYARKLKRAFPGMTGIEVLEHLECYTDEELDRLISAPLEDAFAGDNNDANFLIQEAHEVFVTEQAFPAHNPMLETLAIFAGMPIDQVKKDEILGKAVEVFDMYTI